MNPPELIVITDPALPWPKLRARVEAACGIGPQVAIQYRNRRDPDRVLFDQVRALAELCARAGNPLFVNGRVDLALLAHAHLHLPTDGPRPTEVRAHLPKGAWVSAAAHDLRELQAAAGADFALVSPVFPPTSKPEDRRPTLGVEGLRGLAGAFDGRAYALGGITEETAGRIPAEIGLAVQGAILHSSDPRGAAERICATHLLAAGSGGL